LTTVSGAAEKRFLSSALRRIDEVKKEVAKRSLQEGWSLERRLAAEWEIDRDEAKIRRWANSCEDRASS